MPHKWRPRASSQSGDPSYLELFPKVFKGFWVKFTRSPISHDVMFVWIEQHEVRPAKGIPRQFLRKAWVLECFLTFQKPFDSILDVIMSCHLSFEAWTRTSQVTVFTCEVSIEEAQEKSAGGVTLTLPGCITSVYLEHFGCSTGWIKTEDLLPFAASLGYLQRRTGHYIFDHEASAEEKKRILGDTVQEKAQSPSFWRPQLSFTNS